MHNDSSLTARQSNVWLRIVDHNVFWFQGQPFKSDQPQHPEPGILSALAGVYQTLDADLFCLQEIQSPQAFDTAAAAIGLPGAYTPGAYFPQYGAASFGRSIQLISDWRAVEDKPQRVWQLLRVSTPAGSINVGNFHLPSTRHVSHEQAIAHRIGELKTVIMQPEKPDILLGDFNERPGGPVDAFLTEQGYLDAAALAGKPDLATAPRGRQGDQIWLHKSLESQLLDFGAANCFDMQTRVPGKEFLSDHFPIWIDLKPKNQS